MQKPTMIRRALVCALLLTLALEAAHDVYAHTATALETKSCAVRAETAQERGEGDWNGTLDVGSVRLRLVLHVVKKDAVLSATLDSPDQGATGLTIDSINVTQNSLRFEMQSLGAVYEGKFTKDGLQIEGEWKQQGQSFPLTLRRAGQSETTQSLLKLQRVDIGGRNLNMLIGGKGAPAVVFEGGFGAGIASWSTVQSKIAEFAQTLSYDRAGLNQSDLGPQPRSAKQIAGDLHAALQKVGIKPPYVLVGHSLGGVFVRVFADLYPQEVAGMVLIDPSQETFDEWFRIHQPARQRDLEATISKAPQGIRAESSALDATYAQARAAKMPSGIPVTLLSATQDDSMPEEARKVWIEKHKEWLATIPGSKHIIAEKSGHFIQVQEPAMVIDAIRQVSNQTRK